MELAFHKFQAIGNDYILFDVLDCAVSLPEETIRRLCDRRLGIGADGILLVQRSDSGAPFFMEIINSDGSKAQMCGNGLRSFVKYLVDSGYVAEGEYVDVETRAGRRGGMVISRTGRTSKVTVRVGAPKIVTQSHELGAEAYTIVDVGNMHAVKQLEAMGESPEQHALTIGPTAEKLWPSGINVGFFRMSGEATLDLAVWERGAGYTQACGTGATAAAFVAHARGLVSSQGTIMVRQPGGDLELMIDSAGEVVLTGESECVFSGRVTLHA